MFRSIVILIACSLVNQSVHAGFMYSFGQTNFDVVAGGTVDVPVYLLQVDAMGDPVNLTIDGIFSGGVRVFFNVTPPSDPAAVLSLADIVPNPMFDTDLPPDFDLVVGESAGFVDSIDFFSPALMGNNILLGTFTFTAGNVIGEVTNLRAEDFSSAPNETIANDPFFTPLDNLIGTGGATITVTAVPEPSSLTQFCVAAFAATLRRRRRK